MTCLIGLWKEKKSWRCLRHSTSCKGWDTKIREDFEKMKKIKLNKVLRHYFALKVRGQHNNSPGIRGKIFGASRTKA